MTQDELKALELEALIEDLRLNHECCPKEVILQAADELERLSQRTEQEPVAWMKPDVLCDRACMYLCTKGFTQFPECATTHPPQRTWQGLTDEEIIDVIHPLVMADMPDQATDYEIAKAIEAKLKEKNNVAQETNS